MEKDYEIMCFCQIHPNKISETANSIISGPGWSRKANEVGFPAISNPEDKMKLIKSLIEQVL